MAVTTGEKGEAIRKPIGQRKTANNQLHPVSSLLLGGSTPPAFRRPG